MKFKRRFYGGDRPIHTNTPVMVVGGFNLDPTINIKEGDSIPSGVLGSFDESERLAKIQKTAKVKSIDAEDAKIITLESDMFLSPIFMEGEKVLKTVSGPFADAPAILKIAHTSPDSYVVTLDKEITGLKVGDIIMHVIANTSNNAKLVVDKPYALIIADSEESDGPGDDELGVDVTIDSGNGSFYLRRIPPIPSSMLDESGVFLKYNPNIKFTNSK